MKGNGFKIRKKAMGQRSFQMAASTRATISMESLRGLGLIFGLMGSAMMDSGSMDSSMALACGVGTVETPTLVSGSLTSLKATVSILFPTGIITKASSKNA